jgi:hypothetical protein
MYYQILGVSRNASQQEIKQAYRTKAKDLHPDVNHSPDSHEKFKLVNQAYQVLSVPQKRSEYDASPAECPVCYTHEVLLTVGTKFRCRHCGCQFDEHNADSVIEKVERAAIPERRKEIIRIFQTTQCSWCRNFYTNEPFMCIPRRLQSSCRFIKRLTGEERRSLLSEEKWWWRMADMLREVEEKGVMAKCRFCFALNPNPQKTTCWQCNQEGLQCPSCIAVPVLRYSINLDEWKCPNAACGKRYKYVPRESQGYAESTGDNLKEEKPSKHKEKSKSPKSSYRKTNRLVIWIVVLAAVFFILIVWVLLWNQGFSLF